MLKSCMLQVRPQTISNCLWAFAQLQRKPEGAVQALCSAAWQHVTAFKPQVSQLPVPAVTGFLLHLQRQFCVAFNSHATPS